MSKTNVLLQSSAGHRASPLLSEKLVYIGQLDSYERGSEIAERLLGIAISDSTLYRMTDGLGAQAGQWLEEEEGLRQPLAQEDIIYAQVDGSMILTRESSWKEVKLGRVFAASDLYEENEHRNWLKRSEYVAHLGGHQVFEDKMSALLDCYADKKEQLVFINDGARWQWNWIEAEYPHATQILDFYHVMEHVGKLVALVRKSSSQQEQFMEQLGHTLKQEGIDALWKLLDQLEYRTKTQTQEKQRLRDYIENNRARMDYPTFLKRGLLIGSGAIESAHRTVIQRRMKLAGQRWTQTGAQNMLHLRTLNMSGYWNRVKQHYRKAA